MEKLVKQAINRFRPRGKGKLPKNLLIQVVSLFFALFLWYFVVGEDKVDMTVYVPLEITNLEQNLVISNQFKRQLEVTVNGPRGLVHNIANQKITRPVDLSNYRPGSHVIQNKPESIKLPRGIQIQHIRPANITLKIDRLLEKELPIKPVILGKPATGFEIASIISDPPTLSLSAPAEIIGEEVFLPTMPIEIKGLKNSLKVQVPLDVSEQITELIGEPIISVNVLIREKMVSREFDGIPVEFDHQAERTTYRLDHHQVKVKTALPYSTANKKAVKFHFEANIDADNLPPGRHVLPVNIVSDPPGIRIVEIIPPRITIAISKPDPVMKHWFSKPQAGSGP
jgi:YbbR domain-containing protein